jgi:hypothetical protein
MIAALVLAVLAGPSSFLNDFGGVWNCGNANYHERWDIHPLASHPEITEIVYGDPSKPDGFAFVYYVPSAHEFRYDDFHADGAQSHLTSPGPLVAPWVWEWTGTYYPMNQPADPNPDITWTLQSGTIARSFRQRVNGTPVQRGSDTCTKVSQ